jgi:hypothetical protein
MNPNRSNAIHPSTPQSNNPPTIPIRKESTASTLEGSWNSLNVDLSHHRGIVRQRVEEYSNSLEGSWIVEERKSEIESVDEMDSIDEKDSIDEMESVEI